MKIVLLFHYRKAFSSPDFYISTGKEHVYLVTHRCGFFPSAADTLFATTLNAGDVFIFPRGLVHFQQNPNSNATAKAIAALNSQNAGTVVRAVDPFFIHSSGASASRTAWLETIL
jgi:hypothetical protein